MSTYFLEDREFIPWSSERTSLECKGVTIGEGSSAFEVLVVESGNRPTKNQLTTLYKERRDGRPNPILVVALYNNKADLCGPSGENPSVYRGKDQGLVENICKSALNEPDRNAAIRFLTDTLEHIGDELHGISNRGLLSTHELKAGVPDRSDWTSAKEKAAPAVGKEGEELLDELGYELERTDSGPTYILRDKNKATAVAVLLHEGESFVHSQDRFSDRSPVTYALNKADDENLGYVIANYDSQLRLYSTDKDAGFGSRGRIDTYVQADLNLLPEDNLGYLWLLFSAEALREDGSLEDIMERSKDYAAGLGGRLRERIYDDVVPTLAKSIAEARDIGEPTREELDETYQMALVLLYRLLFIAYAEDERFLPYKRNSRYTDRSLKKKAHELHELAEEGVTFDRNSTTHWEDVSRLVDAIHNGNKEWGLPEYDGKLLSSDEEISTEGAKLAEIELSNEDFGPALQDLLIDETSDGYEGPVDFRNIGVRDFGTIYEGLLESELSVADQPLKLDENDVYVPANRAEGAEIDEGEVYLHGKSGERKSTGTYYTRDIFVSHLLDHSLEPALDEHIEELEQMSDREAEEEFFKFRVADIAMGSGHFLVSAVDRIESRFNEYLADRPLPGIAEELDNLQEVAAEKHEGQDTVPEIDQSQLLRRQIARRCIYGVDINPLATELARLSVWIHTFVPGLPLAFLDHNFVTGDSLAGIATFEEAEGIIGEEDFVKGEMSTSFSFKDKRKEWLEEAREHTKQLGKSADKDAKEVREARETQRELEEELTEAEVFLNTLAASRISDEVNSGVLTELDEYSDVKYEDLSWYQTVQRELEHTKPLHFPVSFPEVFRGEKSGFDVIVGNPPWDRPRTKLEEFWSRYYPGLRGLTQQQMSQKIKELQTNREDLKAKFKEEQIEEEKRREVLVKGPYPGITSGDPDFYQAFSWRFWGLAKEGGSIGVVLPREAFCQKGSEEFRRHLLDNGQILDVTFLKNSNGWVFKDVHQQMTIVLSSFTKLKPKEQVKVPIKGPFDSETKYQTRIKRDPHYFEVKQVEKWTDVAILPMLPSEGNTVGAFRQIQKAPRIDYDKKNNWKIIPYRSGITSSDCKNREEAEESKKEFWPVYKGESFDIWNPDTGTYFGWGERKELIKQIENKKERSRKWDHGRDNLPCFSPRIAFRRVTNRTNQRTIIASLIPPDVFMRDGDPFLLWPRGREKDEAFLIGILSSIPTDWYARRFVEKYFGYYVFNGIPVPRPEDGDILRKQVIKLAGRLAAIDNRFSDWARKIGVSYGPLDDAEKREKIHELDAVVSHLYGLSRVHVNVIFETFHRGWDYQERLDNVLEYYDEWEKRLS